MVNQGQSDIVYAVGSTNTVPSHSGPRSIDQLKKDQINGDNMSLNQLVIILEFSITLKSSETIAIDV